MNEMNVASGLTRRLRPFLRRWGGRGPRAKYFFNLVENHFGGKIAY